MIPTPWAAFWRKLPLDGQGLWPRPDPELGWARRWAARQVWRRHLPWGLRGAGLVLARLAWAVKLGYETHRFAGIWALGLRPALVLYGDGLRQGIYPMDAQIWQRFFRDSHVPASRPSNALLAHLGDPAQHRLLADKAASSRLFAGAGLATPPQPAILAKGSRIDPMSPPFQSPGQLFLKPRHGLAGDGAFAVNVVLPGLYRIADGPVCDGAALNRHFAPWLVRDDLLVQQRLTAAPAMADLAASGAAPVLRINTARAPGAAPFLYSAVLAIDIPGEYPRNLIRGQIRVPVDPATGRLGSGLFFRNPGQTLDSLPWNDAPLTGRILPDFDRAVRMTLAAMTLLPELALINWDLILTPNGPVILEGNTAGWWILTELPALQGLTTRPLIPLLQQWARLGGAR